MDKSQNTQEKTFRIELTNEQKQQVRQATGKPAEAIELSIGELEERIVPAVRWR